MRRQFKLISAILLVVMVATACAVPPTATPTSPSAPTATTAPPTKEPTVAPSATPEPTTAPEPTATAESQADTVTVVDSLGEEVLIPQNVQKVASMRSGITEIICALGQVDKIIAVDEMVKVGGGYGAFIASIHPELMERTAPFSGRDINTEEMLKIAPDVVLHGGYGRIKQAEALKEQAPELPVVITHFETIEHYMDDIRIVAQCVDAEDRAEELISTLQTTLDFVTARVADVPEAEKVRVYYGGHDIYHAYGGETFEHSQIVVAGGVNVAADLTGWMPEVSSEQLLVWDPQVVVLLNGADVDAVLNDPKLTGLSAVKNEQVYSLPEASWDFSSPRALFCIEWLASKFYPDRFADVDIEAEADKFYQNVFGVDYNGPSLVHGHGAPAQHLTEAPAGDFSVAVNGTVFDAAALKELEQVETMEIDLPTGVRILDLLAVAGAAGKSVTLIADDGYQYMVDYAALDDKSVLAYTRDGKLNAVMPGFDMGAWVRSVIEIQVSAAATAEKEEKPAAPAAPEGEFTVTVGDVVFDAAKLGALEQVETGQADTPIGVRVLDLLEAAGVTGEVITLIASDGYQAEVPFADLNDDCVLAYTADGKLNAVMGDLSKATWVKDVVQIAGAGGAEPDAAAPTAPEGKYSVAVEGLIFCNCKLGALEQVETGQPDTPLGVRLLDVLEAAGETGETITLVAEDGYEAEMLFADLNENCYLAYAEDGKLNAVMEGVSKGAWVKGVVNIKVSGGAAAEDAAVIVNGKPFTMDDLRGMEQMETTEPDMPTGVRILDLLEASGAQGKAVTLIADDGYQAEVEFATLDDNSVLAYTGEGKLNAVMPGFDSSVWVRGVVEIAVSGVVAGDAPLVVDGAAFSMDDLLALEQVTVEAGDSSYTGVRVTDLLDAANAMGETITLVAADGYAAEVTAADLTENCILALGEDGKLNAVMPELSKGSWVKDTIEIMVAGAPEGAIVVTDALGREVVLAEPPTRIVAPGKGAWMVGHPLYLFPEAHDRVLAMEERRGDVSEFLNMLHPGFNDKPHLAMDAGPEQIAPLKPDLIIMKSYMAKQLGEPLEKLRFNTLYVELETPEQYYRDIANIGKVFGNEARAEEVVNFYQERVRRVQERIADIADADKPRVLVIQYDEMAHQQGYTVPPAGWMQTIETEMAGGVAVWKEAAGAGGWKMVNFEQVAAWNPEIVFIIAFRIDPEPVLAELKADAKWSQIQAMQDGKVYAYPADYYGWDVPDPRWILGMTWAATKIHPDLFADVDMMQEVYDFYGQMYGMDKDAVDENIVPMLTGDIE